MKKLTVFFVFCFLFLYSSIVLSKDDTIYENGPIIKSPDGKLGVQFYCSLFTDSNMGNCKIFFYEKENEAKQIDNFSISGLGNKKVQKVAHFCKLLWSKDSKKIIYYCLFQDAKDDITFLNVYDVKTKIYLDLTANWIDAGVIEGSYGDEQYLWRMTKILKEKKCMGLSDVADGLSPEKVFMKLDGNKITFQIMRWLTPAEVECSGKNCPGTEAYRVCPNPKSKGNEYSQAKLVSTITQDINTGKVLKKNFFYLRYLD